MSITIVSQDLQRELFHLLDKRTWDAARSNL